MRSSAAVFAGVAVFLKRPAGPAPNHFLLAFFMVSEQEDAHPVATFDNVAGRGSAVGMPSRPK